jgi:large subunit ribosomal protein L15
MAITLHSMRPGKGATKSKKRVGRGLGSKGTTAGRGQKGQTSRSGVGGLKRLGMRHTLLATPKVRGFKSLKNKPQTVSLTAINKMFIAGEVVTPKTLAKKGLITDGNGKVKILNSGELTVGVTIKNCGVSQAASDKILAAGGKVAV